jgi:hypothetical protein
VGDDYPFWLTFGGGTGRESAQSDALAWTVFGLNADICLSAWVVGWYFVREALHAPTRTRAAMKLLMAGLFFVGSFAGFGMGCLMMWYPFWGVLVLTRVVTSLFLKATIWLVWKYKLHVKFFPDAERVKELEAGVKQMQEFLSDSKIVIRATQPTQENPEERRRKLRELSAQLLAQSGVDA